MNSLALTIQNIRPLNQCSAATIFQAISPFFSLRCPKSTPLTCQIFSVSDIEYYSHIDPASVSYESKSYCISCYTAVGNSIAKAKKEFGKMFCCERGINFPAVNEYNVRFYNEFLEFLDKIRSYFTQINSNEHFPLLKSIFRVLLKLCKADVSRVNPYISVALQPFLGELSLIEYYFDLLSQQERVSLKDIMIIIIFSLNSEQCNKKLFLSWFRNYHSIIKNWKNTHYNNILRESIIGKIEIISQIIDENPEFVKNSFSCFSLIVESIKLNPNKTYSNELAFVFEDMMTLIRCHIISMKLLKHTNFFEGTVQVTDSVGYSNIITPFNNTAENSVHLQIFFLSMKCKRAISYFVLDMNETLLMKEIAYKYYQSIYRDYHEVLKVMQYYGIRNYSEPTYSLAFEYLTVPLYFISSELSNEEYIAECKRRLIDIHSQIPNMNLDEYLEMFLSNFLQYIMFLSECMAGKWKYNNIEELTDCMGQSNGTVDKYLLFIQFICALCSDELIIEKTAKILLNVENLSISSIISNMDNNNNYSKILESSLCYLAFMGSSTYKFMESKLSIYYFNKYKDPNAIINNQDLIEYYAKCFALNMSVRGDIKNIDVYNICSEVPKEIKIDHLINESVQKLFIYKDGKVSVTPDIINYIDIFDMPISKNMMKCDLNKKQIIKLFQSPHVEDIFRIKPNPKYSHVTNQIRNRFRKSSALWALMIDIICSANVHISELTKICALKIIYCIIENNNAPYIDPIIAGKLYSSLKIMECSDKIYKPFIKALRKQLIHTQPTNVTKQKTEIAVTNTKKAAFQRNKDEIYRKFQTNNENFISHYNINFREEQSNFNVGVLCSFCKETISVDSIDEPYGVISAIIPSIVSKKMLQYAIINSNLIGKKDKQYKQFMKEYPYVIKDHVWEINMQNIFSRPHYMHYKCFMKMQKESNYLFKCPVCRRVANCLIPVIPSSDISKIDLRKNTPMSKAIFSFLSDAKLLSINQSLYTTKYMKFPSIELKSKIYDHKTLFFFGLSFFVLINRVMYLNDSKIIDSLVTNNEEGYQNVCKLLKAIVKSISEIEGVTYDSIVDKFYQSCIVKFKNSNFAWLLALLAKCVKCTNAQNKIDIRHEVATCIFYMMDLQLSLSKWKFTSKEATIAKLKEIVNIPSYLQTTKIHINRIGLLLRFFQANQDTLSISPNGIQINNYEEMKQTIISTLSEEKTYQEWLNLTKRRKENSEICWYLIFTMPSELSFILDQCYITYFEKCYNNQKPATGANSEKYICISCNKIISISNTIEEVEGKYPCLIKHCVKCWRSHGILINARFGRLLVLTPFNGYEINLPYYNKYGMNIASYLEDSTVVIDVESIKEYTLNATEAIEILQCCISGDDINNTKAIKGGGYIEIFNLLEGD